MLEIDGGKPPPSVGKIGKWDREGDDGMLVLCTTGVAHCSRGRQVYGLSNFRRFVLLRGVGKTMPPSFTLL